MSAEINLKFTEGMKVIGDKVFSNVRKYRVILKHRLRMTTNMITLLESQHSSLETNYK